MKDRSWLLVKKRGNHRTDSRLVGLIAEFSFAGFCILAGVVGLLWIWFFYILPEWRIHERYEKTVCELVDCRISPRTVLGNHPVLKENGEFFEDNAGGEFFDKSERKNIDSRALQKEEVSGFSSAEEEMNAPENEDSIGNSGVKGQERFVGKDAVSGSVFSVRNLASLGDRYYLPEMQLKYHVGGVERTNWTSSFGSITRFSSFPTEESAKEFLSLFRIGRKYDCLFNPEDPDEVVIMRGWQWENFFALIIPSSLFLIGLGVGIHALTAPRPGGSKEKTAILTAGLKVLERENLPHGEFPNLPPIDEITDSPGVRLAYRLPIIDSPVWTLCILVAVTLAWNAACLVFLTIAACSFLLTLADWMTLAYLIPFLGVGIWLLIFTFIQLRNATVIGPTLMEIENFPIFPGKSVHVFLSQGGGRPIQWLNAILVCEEEAVFTHGTNTRRERQRVYQRLIFGEESIKTTRDQAFEVMFPLEIPRGAMHSFTSPRNQIHWRIIVQGKIGRYPMFERSFPLVVYPENSIGREIK